MSFPLVAERPHSRTGRRPHSEPSSTHLSLPCIQHENGRSSTQPLGNSSYLRNLVSQLAPSDNLFASAWERAQTCCQCSVPEEQAGSVPKHRSHRSVLDNVTGRQFAIGHSLRSVILPFGLQTSREPRARSLVRSSTGSLPESSVIFETLRVRRLPSSLGARLQIAGSGHQIMTNSSDVSERITDAGRRDCAGAPPRLDWSAPVRPGQ